MELEGSLPHNCLPPVPILSQFHVDTMFKCIIIISVNITITITNKTTACFDLYRSS
jgi:hypothetical protein